MSNHTPGPWQHVKKYGDNSGPINGPDGKAVASIVGNSTRPAEEKLANARLIASAPELLAIVKTLLAAVDAVESGEITGAYLSKDAPLILHARAVFAKATGSIGCVTLQESPT